MREMCPNCGSEQCRTFYTTYDVPTNSCLLVPDRQQALDFRKGDIALSFCLTCSFIFNALWQADRTMYSEQYEETQGFSPTFNAFHLTLAKGLIERHRLYRKNILEIGCGKGEFLSLLCDLGDNRGVGYDPSFVPARRTGHAQKTRFVQEFFTESTAEAPPDFICCKMTLEHVGETRRFVSAVRRVASAERGTIVFFQIPDIRRILDEAAFWDVYYEHCSYFSPASLAHLFRQAGFAVLRVSTAYDGQYLLIEGRAANNVDTASTAEEQHEIEMLYKKAIGFATAADHIGAQWRKQLRESNACSRRTVLWGSGSKAVAFLTTLGVRDEIEYVVDINPFRQGRFVPGTGQQIVSPSFLAEYRPDRVVVMNPIYCGEINAELRRENVCAELVSIGPIRDLEKASPDQESLCIGT